MAAPQPTSKLWRTAPCDERAAQALAAELGLPLPIVRVLIARGIGDAPAIQSFLRPRLSALGDPFDLPAMQPAVDRIWRAVAARERIAVYGDYDVDGITSTALLRDVLAALGADVVTFLPHRIEEGYGLTIDALARCVEEHHPKLIVTVDCGTGSQAAVEAAAARGIDVVVTDHHAPAEGVARAYAVVNPKLGETGVQETLAGVGVAFKLCHALLKSGRGDGHAVSSRLDLKEHLDLVALGTIADIVPLRDENRILARHGLERLNRTNRLGLKTLMDVAGITGRIDAYEVGFRIGPRLNAAGRLGDALDALELLVTGDSARARELAVHLDRANRERQDIEAKMVKAACEEIDRTFDPARDFAVVVAGEGWHPGVVGIVASRVAGRYNRPAAVIALGEEGVGKGSCRSIEDFDLVAHLVPCAGLLLRYGGHAMAAGLEIRRERLDAFRTGFGEAAAATLRGRDLRPVQRVDAWLDLADVDDALADALEAMRPFGCGNPTPVFACSGVRVVGRPRAVGQDGQHLKMTLAAGGAQRGAIAFGMAARELPDGPLDLAFQVRKEVYQGREQLTLMVQDWRGQAGSPAGPA